MSPFFTGSKSPEIILYQLPTVWEEKPPGQNIVIPSFIPADDKRRREALLVHQWLLVVLRMLELMLGQPNTLLIPREFEDEFQRNRKMSRQKQDKRWWKCDKRDECQHEGREGIRETEKTKFWQGEWRSQEQQVWLAAGKSIWGYHGTGSTPSHSGRYWLRLNSASSVQFTETSIV